MIDISRDKQLRKEKKTRWSLSAQDDIKRNKKLIAGRYETPKQLEGLNVISFKRRTNI